MSLLETSCCVVDTDMLYELRGVDVLPNQCHRKPPAMGSAEENDFSMSFVSGACSVVLSTPSSGGLQRKSPLEPPRLGEQHETSF